MSQVSKKIESLRDDDLINELYEINEIDERRRKERMMKEATEKGLNKGLKQGIKQGLDINLISNITGLSIDEINNLK